MIFTAPTPWKEAIASRDLKTILPTSLSSNDLNLIPAAIRERAMFSASTVNADYLQKVNELITRIVSPETIDGRPVRPGEYMDKATARLQMGQFLDASGYRPSADQRGGLQDLRSDARLNLIIDTNTQMAQGFGAWHADQNPARLDAWPAQEFYRLESRITPRNWVSRWLDAGGEIYGGRMIALKNDPIWTEISAFDLPYPPYDFNSGMWVRDVSRFEAIDLGLMDADTPTPESDYRGFNEDLQTDISDLAAPLQDALVKSMEGLAHFADGVLKMGLKI